jgi:hypothetical protein
MINNQQIITPPLLGGGTQRSSNLELYRIVCMISIVAHHFVVNSGLMGENSLMASNPESANTIYLLLFGMWGKVGINCFMMITGYFMCKSQITLKKFVKLLIWYYFYKLIIFGVMYVEGYESLWPHLITNLMPFNGFSSNFTSCFFAFYLTIPFWNILIRNMSQKQHLTLTALLLLFYTILGSIPMFGVKYNYVTWFGIIYLIASYIRLYPNRFFDNKQLWAVLSVVSILLAMGSVLVMHYFRSEEYFFVADTNKIFAVVVAVSTFLWFKNIQLPYSKVINVIGGTTFGVLLIHANSSAMRQWLWSDTVNCIGHFSLSLPWLMIFSLTTVLTIFFICSAIDRIRQILFEEPFFQWYEQKKVSLRFYNKVYTFPLIKKLSE